MKRLRMIFAVTQLGGLLVLASPERLPGQEKPQGVAIPAELTLDVTTEILLVSNPTILRERQNIAIARSDVATARLRPNPGLDLSSEGYPLFEPNPGPFFNQQILAMRAGQTIETAGKRRKRTQAAEQQVAVSESAVQDTVRQAKFELRQRYYSVVLAKAELELAREILAQFDEILRLNEARFREGGVSGLDLSRVQTERLRFFNDLISAELLLKNAKTSLLELLGARDLTADFDVRERLEFHPLEMPLQSLQEQAEQTRPDLIAERQRVERDRRQVRVEKSLAILNVTPFFGYRREFGANTVAFGVSVPLPLFNRNQGGIARAGAQLQQQGYELTRIELNVRSGVQQAYQAAEAQERRVRAMESTYVASAKKARDIAQASYRLGALDLIVFLDAERAYRETLRSYNQALFDYQVAQFALAAAVGKDL